MFVIIIIPSITSIRMMDRKCRLRYRVHLLGLCYLLTMITYAATTTMMYTLYNSKDLKTLVLIDGIFAYIGFGASNPICLQVMRLLNLKKSIMIGFVGIGIYETNILLTCTFAGEGIPVLSSSFFIWGMNLVTSLISGVANSLIWTSMPVYIQAYCREIEKAKYPDYSALHEEGAGGNEQVGQLSEGSEEEVLVRDLDEEEKNRNRDMTVMMGTFWSIYMWAAVVGGLINIFVLGQVNFFVYAVVVVASIVVSVMLSLACLHPYKIPQLLNDSQSSLETVPAQKGLDLVGELKSLHKILLKCENVLLYNYLGGVVLSFYLIFINKIIQRSLPRHISQQDLNTKTAIVFLFQGIVSILMGLAQSKIPLYSSINKRQQIHVSLSSLYLFFLFLQVSFLFTILSLSLLSHSGHKYWVCFIVMASWSVSEIHVKTAIDTYVKHYLHGKVEYYSLGILMYSLGSITNYLILMLSEDQYEFLGVLAVAAVVIAVWIVREPEEELRKSIISIQLRDVKDLKKQKQKELNEMNEMNEK